ncbi:MAG: hypothetical protein ABW000_10515 [Actinoplanes sp.]
MIEDLIRRYGVTPRKTLTYQWPALSPGLATAFLRGYVDGDGCVATYPTPQGNPMLHVSFVGTPSFIQGAMAVIPADGWRTVIKRCRSLEEARYNGRHAWLAANWLFADHDLFSSAKHQTFVRYQRHLQLDPPKWYSRGIERAQILALLGAGRTPAQVAAETGFPVDRIYALRYRTKRAAAK